MKLFLTPFGQLRYEELQEKPVLNAVDSATEFTLYLFSGEGPIEISDLTAALLLYFNRVDGQAQRVVIEAIGALVKQQYLCVYRNKVNNLNHLDGAV